MNVWLSYSQLKALTQQAQKGAVPGVIVGSIERPGYKGQILDAITFAILEHDGRTEGIMNADGEVL